MTTVAAVEGGPDAGRPWHYGDPFREQRRWEAGEGLVDLGHRGVLAVTGADRLSWLDSLTTQAVGSLAPGESAEDLLLSPHGHIEHALHLVDDGETTWVTTEPGAAEPVRAFLDSMRFLLRVEVADRSSDLAVLGQPSGARTYDDAVITWRDPWPGVGPDTAVYGPPEGDHPGAGWSLDEVVVPRAALATYVSEASAPTGLWALEALRVAAARPREGFETDHRTIPHEVDWLRTAVHLHKGCYRGQETVARVHNLGRPPRRIVLLHLDGSDVALPAHGDEVSLEGRSVGHVTTSARHHELGPVALAVVKRAVPADVPLVAGGVAAAQQVLVAP